MRNRTTNKVIELWSNLSLPLPERNSAVASGLQLVGARDAVGRNGKDILTQLHPAVAGHMQYTVALVGENRGKRILKCALCRVSQPVFYYFLDHAIPRASFARFCDDSAEVQGLPRTPFVPLRIVVPE